MSSQESPETTKKPREIPHGSRAQCASETKKPWGVVLPRPLVNDN
jgi:hypothetical protein